MRERGFVNWRHSLRSGWPCGQRYSLACSFQSKSLLDKVSSLRSVLSHTGTAFINRLSPAQYADIALDPSTLEDPQWKPAVKGVRVLPRPGMVQTVDFPVIYTAEVEGTVYLVDAAGRRRGIGDARLELVNAQGEVLASTKSAPDGYYLLHQVVPGPATLRIAPEQARKLGLTGRLSRPLQVPADGEFLSGQDFELQIQQP